MERHDFTFQNYKLKWTSSLHTTNGKLPSLTWQREDRGDPLTHGKRMNFSQETAKSTKNGFIHSLEQDVSYIVILHIESTIYTLWMLLLGITIQHYRGAYIYIYIYVILYIYIYILLCCFKCLFTNRGQKSLSIPAQMKQTFHKYL